MTHIQQGSYEQGIRDLERAYEAKPHPNVMFNIARAYQDWGKHAEAVTAYQRYLAASPPDAATVRLIVVELERTIAQSQSTAQAQAQAAAGTKAGAANGPTHSSAAGEGAAGEGAAANPSSAEELAALQRLAALTERLESALARAEAMSAPAEPGRSSTNAGPGGIATSGAEAYALETPADAAPYEEVVVTTARRAQSATEAPFSTTIITGEDLRLSGVASLVEVLRRVPGAEVMQMGVGSANISFRGFNQRMSNKVIVLVDGRSEYQDFLGLTLWSSLPVALEEIERIEIIRGPGSALYGANAALGVVNIITRPPGTGPRSQFAFTGGSHSRASGTFLASGGESRLRYRASVSYDQSDKWSRDYADGRPDIASTHADSSLALQAARANLNATYAFDRDTQVGVSGGVNRLFTEIYPIGLLRNYTLDGVSAYAKSDAQLGPVKLKLFWNHLSVVSQPQYEPIGARSLQTQVNSNVFDAEALFSRAFELGGTHQFFAGVSGRAKRVTWDYLDASHAEEHAALFLQDEWRIVKPFRIVASWRVDRHPLLDGGKPGYAQSPRLGAVWMPVEGHAFRASGASAFREPTFLESYTAVRVPIPGVPGASALTNGSTELRPERVVAYELGYRGEAVGLGLEWDLSLYQNEVKDLIALSSLRPLPADEAWDPQSGTFLLGRSQFHNEPAVYTARGAELGLRYSPVGRVDLRASTAFQNITAKDLPENTACGPCTQAPALKLYGGATWRSPIDVDFAVEGAWQSATTWIEREPSRADPTVIENKANPLPAYTVLNARIGYRMLDERLLFSVSGTHLLGAHQQHPFGNQVERRFFATVMVTP